MLREGKGMQKWGVRKKRQEEWNEVLPLAGQVGRIAKLKADIQAGLYKVNIEALCERLLNDKKVLRKILGLD